MNYHQACDLLDRVRHGYLAPEWLINKALQMTGDLDEDDWLVNYKRPEDTYAPMSGARSHQNASTGP